MDLLKREMEEIKDRVDSITVIAKVTDLCNLRCPYCYNKEKHLKATKDNTMSLETMERLVFNIARYYKHGTIILHGGEPFIMGVEWYKGFAEIIKKYKRRYDCTLVVSAQTNATLINEEVLEIFMENGFTFGFSFDGLMNENTRGNTTEILKKIQLAHKYGIKKGAISLVTKENVGRQIEEFEYFNMLGINVRMTPVFMANQIDESLYTELGWDVYVNKACELFNHYVNKSDCKISIPDFDSIILSLLGKKVSLCNDTVCNYRWISVTYNGDYYPCGRNWNSDYHFGNIYDNTFQEAFESEKYQRFVDQTVKRMDYCKNERKCELYESCKATCPATSLNDYGSVEAHNERDCYFKRKITTHVYNYLKSVSFKVNNPLVKSLIESVGGNRCL